VIRTLPVIVIAASLVNAQSDDAAKFATKLLENRYSLSLREGQLAGPAAQLLKSAIAGSRFVLFGETHGLAESATLSAAVCKAAAPEGFRTMAIEEGPLTAAELNRDVRRPDGQAQLAAFLKQYPESVQIYNKVEEFQALRDCAASVYGGIQLWGVNQEALGAGGLILRRILDVKLSGDTRAAVQKLLQKNDESYAKALETGKMSQLFMLSANDRELAATTALLQKDGPPLARSLFASLIQSHEINRAWPRDSGRRNQLMKTLFAADYADALRSESSPPKVLLKFGAFHIYRGWNPVHESGLGNYVAEFADARGAESLHICVMAVKWSTPIYAGIGRPAVTTRTVDLKQDAASHYLEPILSNVVAADWTVFDLRPLRQTLHEIPGAASPNLANLIFGIDLLVIIPDATPSIGISPM
jgi:hypothetical protein